MHCVRPLSARLGGLIVLGLWPCACDFPTPPSETAGDASRWFDVSLPAVSVPDAFLLTQLVEDGATMAIDPTVACGAADAADATLAYEIMPTADAALVDQDALASDAVVHEAPTNACPAPLGPGDLVFDEAMIATEPGSDDRGQWLEIRSVRSCSLDLLGLHAAAPHGESFRTMDVTMDLWLPPGGFFLIADTTDPAENNSLPGIVLAWAGSPADALHKTSDTITLSVGPAGPTIDTLSYPDKKRTEGTSMAFPSRCAPSLRVDFANWQPSVASWTPGFMGTPNAPNVDVMCSVPAIPMCTPGGRRVR